MIDIHRPTPIDLDGVPPGFMRLHEAFNELIELLNVADGCDQHSGLPLLYDYETWSELQRREEWSQRIARKTRAETMMWQSITKNNATRELTVFTRRTMETAPQKLQASIFCRPGFLYHHTLRTGTYRTYERERLSGSQIYLDGLPLFLWESDWAGWKTVLQKDVLKFGDPSVAAETECARWLGQAFATDTCRERRKSSFREEAKTLFGTRLSGRGFDRAWDKIAPTAGRSKAGAPAKSTQ